MKNMVRWMFFSFGALAAIAVVIVGAVLGWFDGWLVHGKEAGAKPVAATAPSGSVRVEVVSPTRRTSIEPAHVEPLERVEIVPKITGYLQSLGKDLDGKEIDTGSRVRAGQVLAVVSAPEMEEDLRIKEAGLRKAEDAVLAAVELQKVAETERDRAQSDLDYRESEFRRQERFYKQNLLQEDLLAEKQKQFEAAKAALANGRARIGLAAAELRVAQASVGVAKSELKRVVELFKYATVQLSSKGEPRGSQGVAGGPLPMSIKEALYVVTRRWADPGAYLQPGTGPQRASILSLSRVDHVKVVVEIPELDSARVELGDKASFRALALPNQTFDGRVSRFSSTLDTQMRRMRVEIDVPNPNGGPLYPGMYGTATVFLSEKKGILVIPSSCVRKEKEDHFIYCMEDGRTKRVPVSIGTDDGIQVEVLKGLPANSQVIRLAHGSLKDGQQVTVK